MTNLNAIPPADFHEAVLWARSTARQATITGNSTTMRQASASILDLFQRAEDPESESMAVDGLATIFSRQAQLYSAFGADEEALHRVEHGWKILRAHARKRGQFGLAPRPNSVARLHLLGTLGHLKWRSADDEWRESVLGPHRMFSSWLECVSRVGTQIETGSGGRTLPLLPGSPEHRNICEIVLWSGLQMACCAWRWERVNVHFIIEEWNDWAPMANIPPLKLQHSTEEQPTHPWALQFEIAKALAGRKTRGEMISREDFTALGQRFMASLRLAGNERLTLAASRRDVAMMRELFRPRNFEVLKYPKDSAS